MISNNIKTVVLLGSLSAIILMIGALIGGKSGLLVAFGVALVTNFVSYFFSDSIVLSMYRAKPLDPNQYPDIHTMVAELAGTLKIPMPRLWLVNTPMANAFATGRGPSHASVAFTTGILSLLDLQELRGVVAHELSHVKNRDVLISTIAATLATVIGYLAFYLRNISLMSNTDDNRNRGRGFLYTISLFLIGLLVPMAATILQLAISRSREYQADETGAQACKDPLSLAHALEKLERNVSRAHLDNDDLQHASTASLFIVYPFLPSNWTALFSTHPPIALRIARLQELSKKLYPNNNKVR